MLLTDGGTSEIVTDTGLVYCFDNRIHTKTKNSLYLGYPRDNNSNLIKDSDLLIKEIIELLKEYKHPFYQVSIDNLITEIQKKDLVV